MSSGWPIGNAMSRLGLLRIGFVWSLGVLAFAQAPQKGQQRDLKVEKLDEPLPGPKGAAIPRSYAVIVGVSAYKNLGPNLQLKFTERDAQSIYTILISPEGGNFKAENVHLLNGEKAT